MSNIRVAIKRKYPRYRVELGRNGPELWAGGSRVLVGTEASMADLEGLALAHNAMRDKLIEASELLAELAPQPVETTPVVHKRWRV